MQNIRVANGHTKELQRGCAKGQKKEQPPKKQTHCPGSNPGSASRQPTALPLGQNLLVEQRQCSATSTAKKDRSISPSNLERFIE